MLDLIDLNQKSLWISVASIFFNPLFWNIAARQEYKNHWITKLFGNRPYCGCYALAITIFSLGIFRDYLFHDAINDQPKLASLEIAEIKIAGTVLLVLGNVFVLTSMWALGVTGTYLGDYFGILMDERVTSFPFNVLDNPMYVGSTLSFLGVSLLYASPAGVLVSVLVYICYRIALSFEEPFTAQIYALRDANAGSSKKNI
ncbi:Phosphatidyl-N-methylethanolamine N-methyltransferase [Mycoemilia scoparia]|uniref:Phosphatidyl-N-methylethanolamine N-methyltransferase n=1 Tax=Mycoemilia scoparia TaxID=417184 RepID=A0A9W7ZPF0_9FUNG|nr:Phosphatidyl-N-methylethanolamine N-methyltransferase [Mycoemilia scoparia]